MPADESRAARMERILRERFAPVALHINDDSALHAGHAGARAGGQTHYTVRLRAEAFEGLSRVARHRAVNDALAPEFATGLHALVLELKTPAEG
jgi:BolA protein